MKNLVLAFAAVVLMAGVSFAEDGSVNQNQEQNYSLDSTDQSADSQSAPSTDDQSTDSPSEASTSQSGTVSQ